MLFCPFNLKPSFSELAPLRRAEQTRMSSQGGAASDAADEEADNAAVRPAIAHAASVYRSSQADIAGAAAAALARHAAGLVAALTKSFSAHLRVRADSGSRAISHRVS